jgi:hypothetical protein
MIKATQSEARTPASTDGEQKQLTCWNKDAQAQCLRVELSDERAFIFPYTHLTFASMEREEGRDVLTASFATHDVRIVGKNLRELCMALQKLAVDWIRPAPARYAALAASEAVFIEKIEIAEVGEESS